MLSTLNCISLGWVHIKPIEPRTGSNDILPERLQQVVVNLRLPKSSQSCHSHPQYREKEHLCGGISGKGVCNGDSGGPLLCPLKDRQPTVYSLVGITSFRGGKCIGGSSKFFTHVNPYIDWIRAEDEPKFRIKPVSGIFDGPLFYYFIVSIAVGGVALICMLLLRLIVCAALLAATLAIVLIIAKIVFSG